LAITSACVATGAIWVVRNQREFQEALKTAKTATSEFLTEHMVEPLQAIVGELVLNQKPEIQDAAALQDTKDSLRRMLADLVKDKHPNMSASELQRVVKNMDMSVVSLQYEKELGSAVRNLMSGDIVRMLLIQVQFIKKELMVAMGAIDELMHANQLNLQMMATVPTFILFFGLYKLTKELFYQVYKRTSERLFYDPGEIAGFFRNILRDIERLLNKQNRPTDQDGNTLDARDTGLLLLLLHQLRDVFDSNRELFDEDEQQRFDEDLNDLIEEGLLVTQQLAVIQRMHHSHPLLQRTKSTRRWLLD
jgi:nuclear control of ATPase protein 2